MSCKIVCTRIQYHTLQSGNGRSLDASDSKVILAAADSIFTLPLNCVFLGAYYNDDATIHEWKFIDSQGNADLTFTLPFPHSLTQSEVFNNDSAEVKIETALQQHDRLLDKFVNCPFVDQAEKSLTVHNASASTQTVRIVYINYSWILGSS